MAALLHRPLCMTSSSCHLKGFCCSFIAICSTTMGPLLPCHASHTFLCMHFATLPPCPAAANPFTTLLPSLAAYSPLSMLQHSPAAYSPFNTLLQLPCYMQSFGCITTGATPRLLQLPSHIVIWFTSAAMLDHNPSMSHQYGMVKHPTLAHPYDMRMPDFCSPPV